MKHRLIFVSFVLLFTLAFSLANVSASNQGPPGDPGPTPTARPADRDRDGWPDIADNCPDQPGTIFGCPDSDGDTIPDHQDACPNQFANTSNGCPTPPPAPDADQDGLPDAQDICPYEGPNHINGCPDSDGDGIINNQDACPHQPGLVSHSGCPAPTAVPTLVPTVAPTFTPVPTVAPVVSATGSCTTSIKIDETIKVPVLGIKQPIRLTMSTIRVDYTYSYTYNANGQRIVVPGTVQVLNEGKPHFSGVYIEGGLLWYVNNAHADPVRINADLSYPLVIYAAFEVNVGTDVFGLNGSIFARSFAFECLDNLNGSSYVISLTGGRDKRG